MRKIIVITVVALASVFLWQVFQGNIILPQVLHIGPLAFRYYGLILGLAVVLGYWLAAKRAAQYGFNGEQLDRIVIILVACGFIGARLYHVFSDFDFYKNDPIQATMIWHGGLSIFGALSGGLVGLVVAKRLWLRNSAIFSLLDWLAPSLLLGQIVGRFGNLFNYEIFGYPTGLPWKMFVPPQFRPVDYLTFSYFHPLFLYEALFNLVALIILLRYMKNKYRNGILFFAYLFLYNAGRFFLEFLRLDSVFVGQIRLNVVTSLILLIIGLAGFISLNYASIFPSRYQRRN